MYSRILLCDNKHFGCQTPKTNKVFASLWLNLTTFFSDDGPLVTYRAPGRAGRGIARCWGWPPPHGAWGHPPCWASGKWAVCWRWDSTAGPLGGRSSPSGFWSTPWVGEREKGEWGRRGLEVGGGECQAEQVEHFNWDEAFPVQVSLTLPLPS